MEAHQNCVCVCVCVCVHSGVEAGWLGVGCCYIFIAVNVYITLLLVPDLLSIPWESPSRSFCVSPPLDVVLCAFPSFFLSCSFVLALSFLLALPSHCYLSLSCISLFSLAGEFSKVCNSARGMNLYGWFYTSSLFHFLYSFFHFYSCFKVLWHDCFTYKINEASTGKNTVLHLLQFINNTLIQMWW